MKHIYIAGPFRAADPWLVKQNVDRAVAQAFLVASLGAVAVCPHAMYRDFNGTLTDAYWIEATRSLLDRCDAAFFMERWQASSGSVGEFSRARELKIPSFTEVSKLAAWLKERS